MFDWKNELGNLIKPGASAAPPVVAPAPIPAAVIEAVKIQDAQNAEPQDDLALQMESERALQTQDEQLIPNHFLAETPQVYQPVAPLVPEGDEKLPPRTPEEIQSLIDAGETPEARKIRILSDKARARFQRERR